MGFTAKDSAEVAAWFNRVEPGFQVSHCSDALLPLSLGEALYADYCDPLADLVKPATGDDYSSGSSPDSGAQQAAASSGRDALGSAVSADEGAASPQPSTAPAMGMDGASRADSQDHASTSSPAHGDGNSSSGPGQIATGGQKRRGGGMRPVGSDTPEPKQFTVHPYDRLLPMPRIAILSGLSEMEWVGICELWDTTGTTWHHCI